MQDSLGDYLRILKNQKPNNAKISAEAYLSLQKKKECQARAMKIVDFLIEGQMRCETFFSCLTHINQEHYQDIVEERAISKLCGFCLCGNELPDMPKKQYHISTKQNKVYDITDRKNFCSNKCYESSIHIKQQIDTSPLWLRKPDDCPQFKLLENPNGLPGQEVDQGLVKIEKDSFTSVSTFTDFSLGEMIESEIKGFHKKRNVIPAQQNMDAIKETDENESLNESDKNLNTNQISTATEKSVHTSSETIQNRLPKTEDPNERAESAVAEVIQKVPSRPASKFAMSKRKLISTNKPMITISKSKPSEKLDVLLHIKKCLQDWFTIETMIFIHGDKKIKDVLNEKKLSDHFDNLQIHSLQLNQQIKYRNICRRLQLQEFADEKFDNVVTGRELKPVPNYKTLKEESKDLDLKVKSFYSGALYESTDDNFSVKENLEQNDGCEERFLPLVSRNSQMAMRRKVFLNSIDKALLEILDTIELREPEVRNDIQQLVQTFKLSANNTVFKPLLWYIIAIVLLQLVGLRKDFIRDRMEESRNEELLELYVKPFGNFKDFLKEIEDIALNIDRFVEYYITHDDT